MQYASRGVSKVRAIFKSFSKHLFRSTSIITLALLFAGTGYVNSTISGEQSSNTANSSYVDSVWIGQVHDLDKIADSDGSALLAISGLGSRVIAIDHRRGLVWSYGNDLLTAVSFDGTQTLSVSVGGDNGHTAIAVDPLDGSVWLSFNKDLLHLSPQGITLSSHSLDNNVVQIAFAESERQLWVATQKDLAVYDEDGVRQFLIDLGNSAKVQALALDLPNGGAWVAQKNSVDRFNANGSIDVSLDLDKIDHLTADRDGNLWAADKKTLFRIHGASQTIPFWLEPFNGQGTMDAIATHPRDGSVWVARNKDLVHISHDSIFLGDGSVGKKVRDLEVYADIFPPTLTFTAPDENAILNTNRPILEFSFADIGVGVDTETLSINLDDDEIGVSCTFTGTTASCQPVTGLPEGLITLIATIADFAGNVSEPTERTPIIDTIAPEITVESPINGSFTNEPQLIVIGQLSEAASLTIDSQTVQIDVNHAFTFGPITLEEGPNSLELVATDDAGNVGELTLSITLDIVPPEDPNADLIEIEDLGNGTLGVTGQLNSVEGGAAIIITNSRTGASTIVTANADGSFSAQIGGQLGDAISLQVQDKAGNLSNPIIKNIPLPPVLGAIGNLTTPIGSTFSLQLSATDPNNDPLTFGVTPLPLPGNASLNATTGQLRIKPTEAGTHTLTFSVTDGIFTDTETIVLNIPAPDTSADTQYTGRLLDANNFSLGVTTPIVGATVSFLNTGRSAVSDSQGYFTITGLPSGGLVLDVNSNTANPAPDGSTYASFRESTTVLANVVNHVERPIYLPRIHNGSLTPVDPNQTTMVVNQDLNVTLEIPPHTAKNADGSDFTGSISISEVPTGFEPAQLPDTIQPGLLVTIQPVGVTFSTPAPITFPNVDNLAPGSEVDIWSLDPESGAFAIVGTGQVTADGQSIQTISGGISAADWHGAVPLRLNGTGQGDATNCGCSNARGNSGSSVNTRSGWLSTDFSIPSYRSLGQSRGLNFIYRSERADPRPIVPFDITIPVRSAVPGSISYQASIGGLTLSEEVYVRTNGLSESKDETIRAAVQMDASQLTTGLYPYNIRVTSNFSRSRVTGVMQDRVMVINTSDSEYGAGWGISGITKLHQNFDGSVLIIDGSGAQRVFEPKAVTLHDWTAINNGTANWVVASNGASVTQTANAGPTVFISPTDVINTTFRGRFRVNTTSDNDFIGLVLGYRAPIPPFSGSATTKFQTILFDWKQANQTVSGGLFGREGFALMSLDQPTSGSSFWDHLNRPGVQVLATNFSTSKGWRNRTNHIYEVEYFQDHITIKIDNATVLNATGQFQPGRFGFYNYSQQNVRYELFTSVGAFESLDGDYSQLVGLEDGRFQRTLKNGTRYEYDVNGLQTALVDRNGNTTHYAYDTEQRLISITDPVGKITTLSYAGDNLAMVTDPAGRITSFSHDSDGNLSMVTFPDGSSKSFGYDQRHLMTTESDERANTTLREFDAAGRFKKSIRADGTTREATTMKTQGLVDPSSGQGTSANPAPFLRPTAAVSTFTDGNSHVTTSETDGFGNITRVTDANGLTTRHARDADGNAIKTTRPDGSIIERTYDDNGNLLTIKELFNNAITSNTYDPTFNLLTSTTDPRGNKTTLNRDARGNVIERINDLGHKTVLVYDSRGLVTKSTDPNGLVTTFVYNATGLLATKTEMPPAGGGLTRVTTFTYDNAGQLTQTVRPDGVTVNMSYDLRGRLLTVIDNLGQKIEHSYDSAGNRTQTNTFDPDGTLATTVQQVYDELNRRTEFSQPHTQTQDSISLLGYDQDGNLLNQTDPNGNVASKVYDAGDRLIQDIDALNSVTAFEYDANNNLNKVTAPNGAVTSFSVDSLGRRTQELSADRGTLTNLYDLANNQTQVTDARGIQATFLYDDLNRVTQVQYPDLTENVTLNYDTCPFGLGRLCARTDESGSYTFSYDVYGNLVQQDYLSDGVTHTTSYQYDAGHNITGITLPSGRQITYARDALKRISAIDAVVNGIPTSIVNNISYRADGVMTNKNYGNGLAETRAYDLQGRLSQQTINALDQVLYSYDLNGNVLNRNTQTDSHGYGYDELDRLIGDGFNVSQTDYSYDPNHNRLSETANNSTIQYNIEPNTNRLTGIDTASLQYDGAGHLLDDGQDRTFVYNDVGRVFQVFDAGVLQATYVYNAQGQRKKKITATETRLYHYDQSGTLLGESTTTGSAIRDYIWQDGTPVAQIDSLGSDSLTFLHTDHLATPRLGTNNSGNINWRWESEAFGNTLPEEDVDGDTLSTVINLRFPGQYYDEETGLHYNRFRYYDPQTGRYISSDPIGLGGGNNTYGYVGQNPTRFIDFLGLEITGKFRVSGFRATVTDSDFLGLTGPDGGLRRDGLKDVYGQANFLVSGMLAVVVDCKDTDDCGNIVREWSIDGSVSVNNLETTVTLKEPHIPIPGLGKIMILDAIIRTSQFYTQWRILIESAGKAALNSPTLICKGYSFAKTSLTSQ